MRNLLIGLVIVIVLAVVLLRGDQLVELVETIKKGSVIPLVAALCTQLGKYFAQSFAYSFAFEAVGERMDPRSTLPLVFGTFFMNTIAPSLNLAGTTLVVDDARRRGIPPGRATSAALLMQITVDSGFATIMLVGFAILAFTVGLSPLWFLLGLLVIALLFGGTAVDRMSACIINGILCLLTENTVSFVFARLHGICPGEVWHYRTCLAALVISILLVGILAARFLRRWNHCSALDPLQALLMSFFPGVVVLLNIFIMISSNRRVPTLLDLMLTVGLTIAVLVHLAIVQMFNDQVVQGQASHFQAALEQQRAEALMESYTAQRRLTHEFTNHIAALDALLRQGDLTGAQEYLSSVSKVVAAGTTILDTHNPLLDSLLSRKYEEAAQQGVELYFDLCDLKDLPFCGTDLVIVISNLLDNAIRAAAQAKPPEVYLRARRNEEEYLISVRNRVQKDLELVDGELPRSTKAEPGHGMGLVNVREVLDRCRCEYTLSCRDRWFRFTCAVPTRKL